MEKETLALITILERKRVCYFPIALCLSRFNEYGDCLQMMRASTEETMETMMDTDPPEFPVGSRFFDCFPEYCED